MKLQSGNSLPNETARHLVSEARRNRQFPKVLNSHLENVGGNFDKWDSDVADTVLQSLLTLKSELLVDDRSISKDQKFDRCACRIIHEGLKLPLNLVADEGFWRWLAVGKFYDVIESRHNRTSEFAGLGNFGIDAPADRNRLKILWLRADIVYDSGETNPYHLACRQSPTDFWESGIIRHRYGWVRNLSRAMVKYQYPDADTGTGTLHLTHDFGIRMLYKQLRRLHSTVAFEYLDEAGLSDLMDRFGSKLQRG